MTSLLDARTVAGTVTDPELPMLTLADLGVLRDVRADEDGKVVVELTPTYTGCPAMDTMRDDLVHALHRAGYDDVDVRVVLSPPWTTDWISDRGRRELAAAGIAPPGMTAQTGGAIPLTLSPTRRRVPCPWCGSADTAETSRYGATACKSLHRCGACGEPFEHFKEH